MNQDIETSATDYIKESVKSFRKIVSKRDRDMFEHMNRENKGEIFVLRFLSMRDDAVLPSELSAALQSSPARISAVLSALEKKRQIVREIDKSNRRNILVTITEEGRERGDMEVRAMEGALEAVFFEMGKADTAELLRLMEMFADLMQKHRNDSDQ